VQGSRCAGTAGPARFPSARRWNAAADLDGLIRIVKRKLKKIQYQPHLIDACLAGTGLTIGP
jgi:hypothetical protein